LKEKEYAFQKYGRDDNTFLPDEASKLQTISDLKQGSSRELKLKQCPECKTYYLYKTDYEYLVNGSEDEQSLTRLSVNDSHTLLNPE
jgi:hypothetical protein